MQAGEYAVDIKSVRTSIFACSGASNCGQIANSAVVQLAEQGLGNMGCLAGIGAHDEKMINSAMTAGKVIVIDGCAVACGRKTLEHAGVNITAWVCVTDHGIKKISNKYEIKTGEIEIIVDKCKEAFGKG